MNQQFRNIVYLADRSGTGVWRRIWPFNSINCIAQGLNIQADYSQTPICDPNYYNGMQSVTVQRWISDQHSQIFQKVIKPSMDQTHGWTIYEIDDLMFDGTLLDKTPEQKAELEKKYGNLHQNSIPFFNRGRRAFEGEKVQRNIKTMLNMSDFVTVTTDYLKQIYHDLYDVPLENIISVPNLLPKYLFGDKYDAAAKTEQFRKRKAKPRIGIVSSLSHYNVEGVRLDECGLACRKQSTPNGEIWINEKNQRVDYNKTTPIYDDLDEILDCIRSTVDDFQWVLFGFSPPKLQDLVQKKKIEVHGGVPIMNYPQTFHKLGLQAVVASINRTQFNYCKSFIKTMECAALGVPCFATDCLPYCRVMSKEQLFVDGDDLKQKLLKLKFGSAGMYQQLIEKQWKWLNSPCREGDFSLKNFWLEDNLNIYIDMLRLRQKTIDISLNSFVKSVGENTIYRNENICIMK